MSTNTSSRVPSAGVWAPAVTFFDPETDSLDLESQARYYTYLSQHLTGLVILGTNAETFMLTREERAALLRTAREAVGPDYEIMAGVGGHSTKQVLEFIEDAVAAKANYALVLPCAYFGKQTSPKVIRSFYEEIARKSPLPVLIYNFPGVCNGIDIESDMMASLHRENANIVGVKLTCASVGKITRLAAEFDRSRFAVFGGQTDFLVAGLSVGSAGAISAFANVAPKTLRRVYELYEKGDHAGALKLQRLTADAEVVSKSGIAGTKYAASLTSARFAGLVDDVENKLAPRRPYESLDDVAKAGIRKRLEEVIKLEEASVVA